MAQISQKLQHLFAHLAILLFSQTLSAQTLSAQTPVTWPQLADVEYKSYYNLTGGDMFEKPKFGKQVKQLEGEKIQIRGYVFPMDVEGKHYILSANPYAACFFCGGAGMETVMELWLTDYSKRYKMDDFMMFTGTLVLNKEPYGLSYILQDAELVKE